MVIGMLAFCSLCRCCRCFVKNATYRYNSLGRKHTISYVWTSKVLVQPFRWFYVNFIREKRILLSCRSATSTSRMQHEWIKTVDHVSNHRRLQSFILLPLVNIPIIETISSFVGYHQNPALAGIPQIETEQYNWYNSKVWLWHHRALLRSSALALFPSSHAAVRIIYYL
jgi:hypothetical protein